MDSAFISDYREAPETGVVFEISSPANNVFSRVNISYVEGTELRSMLYKGKSSIKVTACFPLTVIILGRICNVTLLKC